MNAQDMLIIQHIIHRDDADQLISSLMEEYCKLSVDNCRYVVSLISKVVQTQMKMYDEEMTQYRVAAEMATVLPSIPDADKHTRFAGMTPTVKALYPSGLTGGESPAQVQYFYQWISLLKDPKAFSFDRSSDAAWAEMYHHSKYIQNMQARYCEEDSKC